MRRVTGRLHAADLLYRWITCRFTTLEVVPESNVAQEEPER